ncbi:glycosyltransferase [Shouchella lonarensis]|nr:glycosyltransferase [Shouchella lonarensis]
MEMNKHGMAQWLFVTRHEERNGVMGGANSKKIRVLHGPTNIVNQMETLAKGLSEKGVFCRTVDTYNSFLAYEKQYTFKGIWPSKDATDDQLEKFVKNNLAHQFDLFHLHFGLTFIPSQKDISILRDEGKPLVMQYYGSDIRSLKAALEINPYARVKRNILPSVFHRKIKACADQIKYCVVADAELEYYVKDYYEEVFRFPIVIDLSQYQETQPKLNSGVPLIVHAPTHAHIKGRDTILKVMEELKEDFKFDFQLIQNCSHNKAKAIYEQADLIIDQLHVGCYGALAIETMALGKPVVCYISDFMREDYPSDLPIINANPDTLLAVMKSLLSNQDALPEIGKRSRKYVERVHDYAENSEKMKQFYERILNSLT